MLPAGLDVHELASKQEHALPATSDSVALEEAAEAGPQWLPGWAHAAASELLGGVVESAPVLAVRARAGSDANVGERGSTQQMVQEA